MNFQDQKTTARPSDNAGFTLIELICVFVVMGILLAVAVSRFSRDSSDILTIEAALKNHIRYAQSKAMFTDAGVWGIEIDVANDDYWLVQVQRDTDPDDESLTWGGSRVQPWGVNGGETDYNGDRVRTSLMDVAIDSITGGAGATTQLTLLFDDMGTPFWHTGTGSISIPNTLTLSDSTDLTRLASDISIPLTDTGDSNLSRTITVTRETGFIP